METDVDAIAHNLRVARQAAPGCQMIAVVKANAYGHGLEQVVRRLDAEHPAFFGVANVAEALRVQNAGCVTRPFLLGPSIPEEREVIAASDWGFTISSLEEADHYASLAAEAHRVLTRRLFTRRPRRNYGASETLALIARGGRYVAHARGG